MTGHEIDRPRGDDVDLRDEAGDYLMDPWNEGVVIRSTAEAREWLDGWKEAKREGDNFARRVKDAVIAAMDANAKWTLHDPSGGALTSTSPDAAGKLYFDIPTIDELLAADPPLPQARYNELVRQTIEYKVDAREANRIAKANPVWKAIIDRARRRTNAPRDVYTEPPDEHRRQARKPR